jgi:PhnB protein
LLSGESERMRNLAELGERQVHVYASDVEAIYQRAIAAGAISVQAPIKKDDEDKRGGVKDAGGTTWWIATKVE